jgi:hypothetical protein
VKSNQRAAIHNDQKIIEYAMPCQGPNEIYRGFSECNASTLSNLSPEETGGQRQLSQAAASGRQKMIFFCGERKKERKKERRSSIVPFSENRMGETHCMLDATRPEGSSEADDAKNNELVLALSFSQVYLSVHRNRESHDR